MMLERSGSSVRAYQICARCVMDTTDPWISFDADGLCNHCTDFTQRRLAVTYYGAGMRDSSALPHLFEQLRRSRPKGATHDVVVGVSGGVDSSMTALLAQEAGLKVLAVHMDNGWDTPIAVRNVFRLIQRPGIDYHAVVLDWNAFKAIQRAFIDAGVPDIELPTDIAIQAAVHRMAVKHRIKAILSGGNIANEGILPAAWLYNARDSHYARAMLQRAGVPLKTYRQIEFSFTMELRCRLWNGIRTLYPLNLFSYDKETARAQLKSQIGWQDYGGKHCESTFTRFTQLIYLPRRHKVDYRRGYLSADICLGKVSRQEALRELGEAPWKGLDVAHDTAFVARKLDFRPEELESAMQGPALWYKDYPNREWQLGLAYNSYRLLTGRKKASNF
jgi:N-acetyl sugar amidotransferase